MLCLIADLSSTRLTDRSAVPSAASRVSQPAPMIDAFMFFFNRLNH